MGNCLRHGENMAKTKRNEPEPGSGPDVDPSEDGQREGSVKKGDQESNVVRIKVLVTRDELRQILGHSKNGGINSVEHLVHFLKHRAQKISGVHDDDGEFTNANWRPTLDAIPEDYYRHLYDYFRRD